MSVKPSSLKSAAFIRYKKTVIIIAGKENWNQTEEFYIRIYEDFLACHRGYSKMLHLLYLCIKTQNKNDKRGSARYLNRLLKTYLVILKSEGFEEVKS